MNFSFDIDYDGVEVVWDTGYINVYRFGYKGCVDVKVVEFVSGGFYYKDYFFVFSIFFDFLFVMILFFLLCLF